jgi:hypothetical protein
MLRVEIEDWKKRSEASALQQSAERQNRDAKDIAERDTILLRLDRVPALKQTDNEILDQIARISARITSSKPPRTDGSYRYVPPSAMATTVERTPRSAPCEDDSSPRCDRNVPEPCHIRLPSNFDSDGYSGRYGGNCN